MRYNPFFLNYLLINSCQLDPIPTILLKDCLLFFSEIISQIIYLNFDQASVPSSLKAENVIPIFKKPSLDPDVLN